MAVLWRAPHPMHNSSASVRRCDVWLRPPNAAGNVRAMGIYERRKARLTDSWVTVGLIKHQECNHYHARRLF